MYVSLLGISAALYLSVFEQPVRNVFLSILPAIKQTTLVKANHKGVQGLCQISASRCADPLIFPFDTSTQVV